MTRCKHCKSTNVEVAMWVNPNTLEVGDGFGTHNEPDAVFCNDCEGLIHAGTDMEEYCNELEEVPPEVAPDPYGHRKPKTAEQAAAATAKRAGRDGCG